MSTPAIITLDPRDPKQELYRSYYPSARFHIPRDEEGSYYTLWLNKTFADFIQKLSTHRVNQTVALRLPLFPLDGAEGGVQGIYIGDEYFHDCKASTSDGVHRTAFDGWKGIWLSNHFNQSSKVEQLYRLAEKFELFLQSRNIPYQRFGRTLTDPGEIEQLTKFPN